MDLILNAFCFCEKILFSTRVFGQAITRGMLFNFLLIPRGGGWVIAGGVGRFPRTELCALLETFFLKLHELLLFKLPTMYKDPRMH